MFNWKQHFFQAHVNNDGTNLKVNWCPVFQNTNQAEECSVSNPFQSGECSDSSDNLLGDSAGQISKFQSSPSSTEKYLLSCEVFSFGKNNRGKLLKAGFSFDCACLCRIPVILIKLEDSLKHSKYEKSRDLVQDTKNYSTLLLIGVKENTSTSSNAIQEKHFSLSPLRLFRRANPPDIILHNRRHLRFVSDFGFFSVQSNQHLLTLKLCFGHLYNELSQTMVQNFVCDKVEGIKNSEYDFSVLDVFNSFVNKMFLVVIKVTNGESHDKCVAFLFCNLYGFKYEMKKVEIDSLFPEEFAQILKSLRFSSVVLTKNPPSVKSVSLMMLSSTNYAIRFSQGHMTHCVALDESCRMYEDVAEQFEIQSIDYICENKLRTALHIQEKCLLIDWINGEISVLQSEGVQMVARHEEDGLNAKRMLLAIAQRVSDKNVKNESDRWIISVIDIECAGESDDDTKMNNTESRNDIFPPSSFYSPANKNSEQEQPKMNEATRNVLKGLMCQEKKCQIDLMDLKQSLTCKEIFLEQTLKRFSWLKDNSSTSSKIEHFDQPPMLPLIAGIEGIGEMNNKERASQRHWKVEKLWKRTIDKILVCGVDLVKMAHLDNVCDIYLVLVPINPGSSIMESKSSCLHLQSSPTPSLPSAEPSSPARKKPCLSVPECSLFKAPNTNTLDLSPPLQLAACIDLHDFFGCGDINIQMYLNYSVLQTNDHGRIDKQSYMISCGILSLSQEEKLEESWSLKSQMKKCKEKDFLTTEDIVALGCVQNSLDLQVSSMLSPVISLLHKVQGHSSMMFMPEIDQYVFSTDHQLQFCRMKWLSFCDKFNAVIRIFARAQDDLLLFIEFLDSISPSDLTFHLHNSETTKHQSVNIVTKTVCDKVDESIHQIKNRLETVSIPIKDNDDIHMETVSIPVKDNDDTHMKTVSIPVEVDIEIIEDISLSPKFHSLVSKMEPKAGTKIKKHEVRGVLSAVNLASGSDRTTSPVDDLNLFDMDNEFVSKIEVESKSRKGLGARKGGKGKGKLTMKKK